MSGALDTTKTVKKEEPVRRKSSAQQITEQKEIIVGLMKEKVQLTLSNKGRVDEIAQLTRAVEQLKHENRSLLEANENVRDSLDTVKGEFASALDQKVERDKLLSERADQLGKLQHQLEKAQKDLADMDLLYEGMKARKKARNRELQGKVAGLESAIRLFSKGGS